MLAQTVPSATYCSASMPSCRRARGLDASRTTLARRAGGAAPRRRPASRSPGPRTGARRAAGRRTRGCPPGHHRRPRLSTFTTHAPTSPSRCAHSGPAHSEVRSTTSGRARWSSRGSPAAQRTGGRRAGTGPGGTGTAGKPSSRPRETAAPSSCPASQVETASHGSPARSLPTSAGSRSMSSGRASDRPSQPSAARRAWKAPPTDQGARRDRPASAARSPRRRGPGSRTPGGRRAASSPRVRARVSRSNTASVPARALAGAPGARAGGPSAGPVKAMAPDLAQSAAADVGLTRTTVRSAEWS